MGKRPNILFLFSDQHNARVLGCQGHPDVKTPHLDTLASQGVMLNSAYAQSPICTPSRMCFLSGQYCMNHGYYGLMGPPPASLPSLFSHVRGQGYRTGAFGKIHTPLNWLGKDTDVMADMNGKDSSRGSGTIDPINDYDAYLESRGLAHERDDRVIPEWFERHGTSKGQGIDARASRLEFTDTVDGWSTGRADAFMRESVEGDAPFCAWLTLPRPHETYLPARGFWDLYDESNLTLPPNADDPLTGRSPITQKVRDQYRRTAEWTLDQTQDWELARRRVLRGYYGCVSQVDACVGQLMATLDELGIRDNTIVVYSSDHGEFAGEHGMIEKAPGIGFRCVTRIPMIFSWPGRIAAGEQRNSLVESVDVFPSLCALAGLPEPDAVDGHNIEPLLADDTLVREYAFTEQPLTKTIQSSRYKLTLSPPGIHDRQAYGELFDHVEDPWERRNVYDDEAYAAIREELTRELVFGLATKRRPVTAGPNPPPRKDTGARSWDDAEDLYASDGKIRPGVMDELVRLGRGNYI